MKNGIKVLMLEDNEDDAEMAKRLLVKEFPHLQHKLVMNRGDYLRELKSFQPDVILSDNSLPDFDATEALQIFKTCQLSIPFILVTGTVSEEFAANIMKAGADDYILKDRMLRLPAAIETALKKKSAEMERKQARRHLAESEEKYRTLYERMYAGVYRTNINGDILSCNTAFAKMFGYNSPEQLQLKNASVLYFSDNDREAFIANIRRRKQITNHETILKHKNGDAVYVLENLSIFTNNDIGEEIIEGIILDISLQKNADEERKRLSSIIEATSDFAGIVDVERNIVFLNKAGRKMTGHSETEDISDMMLDDFVPQWVQRMLTREVIPATLKKGKWGGEISLITKTGKEIPVSVVVIVLRSHDGKPEFFCAIARDITELKKAKEQIEFDSSNFSALINNTNDMMWSVDTSFRLITCNNSFCSVVTTPAGLQIKRGDNVLESSWGAKHHNSFKDFYERAFAGESFKETEFNSSVWSEISFYPIYSRDAIIGTACFSHDITTRKKADEAVQKLLMEKKALADRMGTILNTLPANIALLDEQGVIIEVNDAWRHFAADSGFKGDNFGIGHNYLHISAAATGDEAENGKIISVGIKAVMGRLTNSFEYEYPCHSPSEQRWFRLIVTPLRDKEKGGVVVMHINITEQKKNAVILETTLKELSDYKIALDASSIVSITDPKGMLTYVNTNFCTISKYNRDELLGKDHNIINASFHSKTFVRNLWLTISRGNIWRNEMKNQAKDGSHYWVDTTIVPFLDSHGKPTQYVAINKDITEQKLIEQELLTQKVQEQKKITQAIMLAQEKERNHLGEELHDNVNQILAGAKLYLSTAGHKNEKVKKLISYPLELIDNSVEEIRLLCHNLVTPVNNIDLDQMVRKLLYNYHSNTAMIINFTCEVSPGIIKDDLKLNIYRIIQEQMNNISKHAKASTVNLTIREHYESIRVTVEDDGIGFNVNSVKEGIGISNMRNRIESYNGKVDIKSSPGKGTITKIDIPYQENVR